MDAKDQKPATLETLKKALFALVEILISILEKIFGVLGSIGKFFTHSSSLPSSEFNVKDLNIGYLYVDGWAEIVEGFSEKADKARTFLHEHLQNRIPISVSSVTAIRSPLSKDVRPYLVVRGYRGTITTVYLAKHGTDLYASWRTYISPILNWILILVYLAISARWAYAIVENVASWQTPDYGLVPIWMGVILTGLILITLFLGNVIKRNPVAFFFIERTVFDIEDTTAISLATHHSVLRALDTVGADVSKLRLKTIFTAGRKGEEI